MQYVRSLGGSVSKTWNSINPATLSGAIDVIVIEQEDGSLACSPFHVRFGKFSLLRPYEKKVEFRVNNVKQDYAMKLGEGGEAFFVFETSSEVPEGLQTSPLVSPASSPKTDPNTDAPASTLQEPDFLDISGGDNTDNATSLPVRPKSLFLSPEYRAQTDLGQMSASAEDVHYRPSSREWSAPPERSASDAVLPLAARARSLTLGYNDTSAPDMFAKADPSQLSITPPPDVPQQHSLQRSNSPPPLFGKEAVSRAISLSKKLSGSNIPTHITDTGDLMLDMTGYKSSEDDSLRAEMIARKILSDELEGSYDIGALIGADEHGNLWIYSSEEAKEAANRKYGQQGLSIPLVTSDAASDPGYHSDDGKSLNGNPSPSSHQRAVSESDIVTPPKTPEDSADVGESPRSYAKTLRLTSDQLKALNLKRGPNTLSFTVNRATCTAYMYLWRWDVPVVISDIDGTITKSDALGHVLNMIGRDWTHVGVAKLYTDIVSNGYNIFYLTSRSVGQADMTRTYLNGVIQDGYKLPKGPVIMSPDRTLSALRREIYLRKPEVFKMACLRDIQNLYPPSRTSPFYAGFGNRLTDALSYRSVNIPSNRIFTINSNAEVSLDLLSLNKYKSSYVTMRELLDHFFPPVSMLIEGGGEQCTDFSYWRDAPLEVVDFSASESEEDSDYDEDEEDEASVRSGEEAEEHGEGALADSFITQGSLEEPGELDQSILESIEGDEPSEESYLEEAEEQPFNSNTDDLVDSSPDNDLEDEPKSSPTSPGVHNGWTVSS